jgi:hypothetical protein
MLDASSNGLLADLGIPIQEDFGDGRVVSGESVIKECSAVVGFSRFDFSVFQRTLAVTGIMNPDT